MQLLISLLVILLASLPALAQPITYQDRLTQSLTPVSGWVDLRFRLYRTTNQSDLGLIAQDVREVLPHLVVGEESKENLTVNCSQLSVVAIGAIQEQEQKIESLEQRLRDLETQLARMQQLLGAP